MKFLFQAYPVKGILEPLVVMHIKLFPPSIPISIPPTPPPRGAELENLLIITEAQKAFYDQFNNM